MPKTKAQIRAENDALMAGAPVRKIAAGVGNGMTHRAWYRAARDQEISRVVEDFANDDLAEALSERRFEIGCALGVDGINDFNSGVRKHGAHAMLGWAK